MPAIDPWAVLKNVRPGQVITISSEMSPEFAGDYEVVERRLFPLIAAGAGGSGSASGSATLARPVPQDAGQIELVLRRFTLDRFSDQADEPTFAAVPGTKWWFDET